eukprot:scaffold3108_cov152-Cylindrotheca_fusiformis.AAC.12
MKINCFIAVLCSAVSTASCFQASSTKLSSFARTPTRSGLQELSNRELFRHSNTILFEKEDGLSKGMEDAFRKLEDLKALEDDSFSVPGRKGQQDEAFAKAMESLDLKGIEDKNVPPPAEAEAALYSDMASEISGASELDLIDEVKNELGGKKSTVPQFDPNARETEKFMEKALDEAIEEVKRKGNSQVDKETLLDNKEIMKEIEAIFDRANDQLIDGLEDIRKEQIELAESSAMRSSKESDDRMREDEQRLAQAETNMRKMLAKVNAETKNVESAIEDLKNAQAESEGSVDGRLIDLKSGGLVKQATLVGTLLFSIRSIIEGIAFLSGDPTHLLPAVIQGGIALLCLAVLIFWK